MGDTGLHVRGRAGPAQVRDGAQRSGLAQYSTGLAPLTPLCQGMSWAGTSVVRSCWDLKEEGLGHHLVCVLPLVGRATLQDSVYLGIYSWSCAFTWAVQRSSGEVE